MRTKYTQHAVDMLKDHIPAMREWLKECYDTDQHDCIDDAFDIDIVRHIEREFHGGVLEFVSLELDCAAGV